MSSTLVAALPGKLFFAVTMPASQLTALTFSIIDEDLLEDLLEDRLDEFLTKSWFDFERKASLSTTSNMDRQILCHLFRQNNLFLFYELPDVFLNNLQNWHSLYCLAQTRTNLLEELPSGLDEGLCTFCCNSIMICSLHTDNLRVLLKCLGRSV